MTESRRPLGPRALVPIVIGAAAAVVLMTAAEGRVTVSPMSLGAPSARPLPQPSAGAPMPVSDGLGTELHLVIGTVLLALGSVVAVLALVLLLRLLLLVLRRPRRRTPAGIDASGLAAELQLADAPTVRRGIGAALAAFAEHREPTDAIVQAWLGLQQTAEDAGFARAPSETPTEFTGRVLTRSTADRAALGVLLRLYLRARFDSGAVSDSDAAEALAALRALEASWGSAPVAGRR